MPRRLFPAAIAALILLAAGTAGAAAPRQAPDAKLPPELKDVPVQARFLALSDPSVGALTRLKGNAVVSHGADQAYWAAVADDLYLRDTVHTLAASQCLLKFPNHDLASLGENTRLAVKAFLDDPAGGRGESSLELLRGKAMFHMLPLLKYKDRARLVETPTAVAGVRGTQFGLDVHAAPAAVTQAGGPPVRLAQAGAGDWITLVYCFEGRVEVLAKFDGRRVNLEPGQRVAVSNRGLGPVGPIGPEEGRRFLRDTLLDHHSGQGVAGWPSPGPNNAPGAGGPHDPPGTGPTAGDGTTPPQELSVLALLPGDASPPGTTEPGPGDTNPTTPPSPPGPTPPAGNVSGQGYFTTLLGNSSVGAAGVYLSTSLQDFDAGNVRADLLGNAGHLDASQGFNHLVEIDFDEDVTPLGSPAHDIEVTQTGDIGGYLQWGSWVNAGTSVTIGGIPYLMDSRGWWVSGVPTPASAVPGTGTFTYAGQAWGTFINQAVPLTGTFSCVVIFNLATIDDFDLFVTNGTAYAQIENGVGSINGNSFNLNPAIGNWVLHNGITTPLTASSRALWGSFYGPDAEHMAGTWGMYADSSNAASGIFIGNR